MKGEVWHAEGVGYELSSSRETHTYQREINKGLNGKGQPGCWASISRWPGLEMVCGSSTRIAVGRAFACRQKSGPGERIKTMGRVVGLCCLSEKARTDSRRQHHPRPTRSSIIHHAYLSTKREWKIREARGEARRGCGVDRIEKESRGSRVDFQTS